MVSEDRVSGSELKGLEQTRVSLERARIQNSNRVSAVQRGDDQLSERIAQFYAEMQEEQEARERKLEQLIARQVHTYPVWDYWLKDIKGIGEGLAAQMLSLLLPPLEDRGPSTWYKAAGLTVEIHDGIPRLPRARAGGGKITYHKWLRRCLYNVGTSFVRTSNGYYRDVYDRRKRTLFSQHAPEANKLLIAWESKPIGERAEWLLEECGVKQVAKAMQTRFADTVEDILAGDTTSKSAALAVTKLSEPTMAVAFSLAGDQSKDNIWPMYRIDSVARWMMVKLFLSHLYEMWLESEGKTGRQAYVIEKLGHHYIAPPRLVEKGKKI